MVLHACDTPACVHPGHLMVGTKQANAIDARTTKALQRVLRQPALAVAMRRVRDQGRRQVDWLWHAEYGSA
jgi:hypothetical protein